MNKEKALKKFKELKSAVTQMEALLNQDGDYIRSILEEFTEKLKKELEYVEKVLYNSSNDNSDLKQ